MVGGIIFPLLFVPGVQPRGRVFANFFFRSGFTLYFLKMQLMLNLASQYRKPGKGMQNIAKHDPKRAREKS